jgi:predicted alpha/beta superfamily hydrolase
MTRLSHLAGALVLALSCSTPAPPEAAASVDAGAAADAGLPLDAGSSPDAGAADAGLGTGALELQLFGVPQNTPAGANFYAAGSFNQWNPADPAFRLTADGTGAFVTRVPGLREGDLVEFKFTRGAWANVEKQGSGAELPNRRVGFDPSFPRVAGFVARWADLPLPASSRTGDVRVFSTALPQLSTTRNVWVYLPPRLAGGPARFPVLYAFDAQNLFDRATSTYGREWQLDETLERLVRERRLPPVIVVGVESSAARACEYNVFASDPHPGCATAAALGDSTIAFLTDTLKPRIDADYPTLTAPASTGVLGSSMGGSMAMRAGLSRPDVFSRVAALSPSYQNTATSTPAMPAYVRARAAQALRIYQDMGTSEQFRDLTPAVLQANALAVDQALADAGYPAAQHRLVTVDGGTHDEAAWAARVDQVLSWLWGP